VNHPPDEQSLVTSALADAAAREKLVLRYYLPLQLLIRRRLPMWMERYLDEEDVLQDTFTLIFSNLDAFEFRGPGSFFGWASRIASNHILNQVEHFRAKKRHGDADDISLNGEDSSFVLGVLYRLFRGQKSPRSLAADRELVEQLNVCLKRLEPQQYQVIQLRVVEGHSVKSTAKAMGRTQRAVEQLTYRSLMALRRMFPKSRSGQQSA